MANQIIEKRDAQTLIQTPLFQNLEAEELEEIKKALMRLSIKEYKRGEILLHSNAPSTFSGLMLKGRAKIRTAPNIDGTQSTIVEIGPGEMFGEPFNYLSFASTPSEVIASQSCKVLTLDLREIINLDVSSRVREQLLTNLAWQFAEKIVVFRNKVEVLSQPTTKMRILTAIRHQQEYQDTNSPTIKFNKSEFAEYLCVNRNTFTKTISNLEEAGDLLIEGNKYTLLKPEEMYFVKRTDESPKSVIHRIR